MIKFVNTTPEEVRTGKYLFSLGNEEFPLCIVSKREMQPVNGKRMFELGLSPKSDGQHAGVGTNIGLDYRTLTHDAQIIVLHPRYVPLDKLSRETKFGLKRREV